MGRPTRLSTIVHDPEAYGHAARAARSLRTKIHELSVNHGLDAAYLAAGTASCRRARPFIMPSGTMSGRVARNWPSLM